MGQQVYRPLFESWSNSTVSASQLLLSQDWPRQTGEVEAERYSDPCYRRHQSAAIHLFALSGARILDICSDKLQVIRSALHMLGLSQGGIHIGVLSSPPMTSLTHD